MRRRRQFLRLLVSMATLSSFILWASILIWAGGRAVAREAPQGGNLETEPAEVLHPRQVAVTFDDLPATFSGRTLSSLQDLTTSLLGALDRQKVPTIGFVNEGKLHQGESLVPGRVAVLERWLDAGHELGNHAYSHPDLHRVTLEEFQQDVLRGEEVTRRLLRKHGKELEFFRHPYLHTGRSLATKTGLESFLELRGYRVAPVSIDNSEYIFARAFDLALRRDDTAAAEEIIQAYLGYMEKVFAYYERQSEALLGYELPQILLLHSNWLNAIGFERLAERIRDRGYTFITLRKALEDPAYRRKDTYIGTGGITWLHRWALTEGKKGDFFAGEPEVPRAIRAAAQLP